jgi:hypothetical protein
MTDDLSAEGPVVQAHRAMCSGMLQRDTALLDGLQLTTTDERRGDAWIAVQTVATTF